MKLKNVVLPFTLVAAFLSLSTFVHSQTPDKTAGPVAVTLSLTEAESLTMTPSSTSLTFSPTTGDTTGEKYDTTATADTVSVTYALASHPTTRDIYIDAYFTGSTVLSDSNGDLITTSSTSITWTGPSAANSFGNGMPCTGTYSQLDGLGAGNQCGFAHLPITAAPYGGTWSPVFTLAINNPVYVSPGTYTGTMYLEAMAF
jgi:hypothetical protein